MPILDESKRPSGARGAPSVYSQPYQYGYVPNGSSTPVLTPAGQIARQYTSNRNGAPSGVEIAAAWRGLNGGVGANPSSAALNSLKNASLGSGSGGRGGGGGGGAAGLTQEQMDWMAQLLKAGRPKPVAAQNLDLPDYQGMPMRAFDPSMYDQLAASFGQAVNQDRSSIDTAYNNADAYLKNNYKNAFAGGPPPSPQQGMSQDAMARLMQQQGVNPANNQQLNNVQQGTAAGNAAFGNLWGLLGANEDTAQGNRLLRSQQDRGTSNQALNAAALQGTTGIGLQRTKAQGDWQQQADARAYADYQMQQQVAQQEAMQNWQRQNTVTDTNATNAQGWNASTIQSLISLLGKFGGNLPDLASLGLG
jgi:hypothetical protein